MEVGKFCTPKIRGNFQHLRPGDDCLVDEEEREAEGQMMRRHRGGKVSSGQGSFKHSGKKVRGQMSEHLELYPKVTGSH